MKFWVFELGNLCPEGMPMVITSLFIMLVFVSSYLIINFLFYFLFFYYYYLYIYIYIGARRPHLSRFFIERVQKARLHTNRTFHFWVSLQGLATWGLGSKSSAEAIAHELTIHRRKFPNHFHFPFPLFFFFN